MDNIICEKMNYCLNMYVNEYHNMEVEDMALILLEQLLTLVKSQCGYIACSHALEPEKMKYVAVKGLEPHIKLGDIALFKQNKTFFVPLHLRSTWIVSSLSFKKKLCGVIGFQNLTNMDANATKEWLKPFLSVCSNIIGGYIMSQSVNSQHDMFLSTMSHEIRTPLNGIVGMSRILKESNPLTSEQKSYINVVSECTYQLLELVNDILDFSKMGCDQLLLESEPFDLRTCVEEVYDLVYLRIQEKKLNLWSDYTDKTPVYFVGDKKRIRQILLNLVNNAIKFTEMGHITIRIYAQKSDSVGKNWTVHFEIEDTGIGIQQMHNDIIFKSFQQVRNQNPNCDGTGLGLAICKKLCKLMNGDIEIKNSTVGKGTCMHFYIPLNEASENFKMEKEKESAMQSLKDKTILVVDTQTSRRIKLVDELMKLQTKVHSCSTFEEGLAYINHHIMFDICMIEKTEKANQLITELKQTPIVEIEFTDKDISSVSFSYSVSSSLLGAMRNRSGSNSNLNRIPMDILVVEDNPYNLYVIVEMLRKLGYDEKNIDTAKTGTESIQKSITKVYDIILMDLLLPMISGTDATAQILNYYKNKCPKHLKPMMDKYDSLFPTVIALTAMVTDQARSKCKQVGFKGFLSKPIDKEELDTMLTIVTKRRLQSRKLLSGTK